MDDAASSHEGEALNPAPKMTDGLALEESRVVLLGIEDWCDRWSRGAFGSRFPITLYQRRRAQIAGLSHLIARYEKLIDRLKSLLAQVEAQRTRIKELEEMGGSAP